MESSLQFCTLVRLSTYEEEEDETTQVIYFLEWNSLYTLHPNLFPNMQ